VAGVMLRCPYISENDTILGDMEVIDLFVLLVWMRDAHVDDLSPHRLFPDLVDVIHARKIVKCG
jgi:hypothetical protein